MDVKKNSCINFIIKWRDDFSLLKREWRLPRREVITFFFFFFLQREYFDSKIGDKNKRGPRFPLVYDRTKCETSSSPFWVKKLRFRLRSTIREKEKRPRRFKFRSGDAIFLLNTGAKVESFGYRDEDKFDAKLCLARTGQISNENSWTRCLL